MAEIEIIQLATAFLELELELELIFGILFRRTDDGRTADGRTGRSDNNAISALSCSCS